MLFLYLALSKLKTKIVWGGICAQELKTGETEIERQTTREKEAARDLDKISHNGLVCYIFITYLNAFRR